MLDFYQNLPQLINPVAFSVGSFDIFWYSLMYLIGFLVVSFLLYWRVKKNESFLSWNDVLDFLLNSFLGIIIGGRLGYVLFYNLTYFLENPLAIFFPVTATGDFEGIYGMSFHGGVLGFILVAFLFSKKKKIYFLKLTDFIVPAIPAGYFFGRIGNFLNGELYGREAGGWWGMNFGDGILRHPSQIYEALGEGVILFLVLWFLRNDFFKKRGLLSSLYLIGYGLIRFMVEFFREPDSHLGFIFGNLTTGQILSLIMMTIGLYLFVKKK